MERKNFLDRVDHRQFELEKAVRLNNMKRWHTNIDRLEHNYTFSHQPCNYWSSAVPRESRSAGRSSNPLGGGFEPLFQYFGFTDFWIKLNGIFTTLCWGLLYPYFVDPVSQCYVLEMSASLFCQLQFDCYTLWYTHSLFFCKWLWCKMMGWWCLQHVHGLLMWNVVKKIGHGKVLWGTVSLFKRTFERAQL